MKCPACGFNNMASSSFCSHCGISLPNPKKALTEKIPKILIDDSEFKFKTGDFFGERYKILSEIDRGGMGRVYKARDKELNIVVALKIIHPYNLTDKYAVERFKKEILLAREISHENVIRIHDFGEEQGIKFISMQYVEGDNLKDLIQKKGMIGLKRALDISRQICNGLQVAHKKGIVHRDLKPHNIMIDRKGNAYIMDFGLAKSIEGEGISLPDMVVGTPEYISPEQAKGEKVDARSDIYSLGIMMYEMVTGKLPFASETVLGYITQHIHKKPASPSFTNPLIPSFFSKIILRCLEKKPAKRYPSTQEILKDFAAEEVASGPFFRRPIVRRILTVFAVITLLLLVAFGVSWIKERGIRASLVSSADERKSVAILYFDNQTGDHKLDNWGMALADLMITDLAQSRYFRVMPENRLFQILKDLGQKRGEPIHPEIFQKIGSSGGVDYVISGSFTRAGEIFRIGVKILNSRTGEFMASGYADGQGVESFFSLVDQLTAKIKTRFNITQPNLMADIDREITRITTSSPEAFQKYIEGKHYINLAKYEQAIQSFQKAIDIDPDFAMAYWAMGWAHAYIGDWEKRKIYFNKTMELRDHMSERERYLIEATFYGESEATLSKSIIALKKILAIYPDDCEVNEQLGIVYLFVERWGEAIKKLETNRRNGCLSSNGCLFLSHSYLAGGDHKNALAIIDEGQSRHPDYDRLYEYRARVFLDQNKLELALIEFEKAYELGSQDYFNKIFVGDAYLFMNNMEKAKASYQETLSKQNPNQYINAHQRIQNLYFSQGRFQECQRLFDEIELDELNSGDPGIMVINYIIHSYYCLKFSKPQQAIHLTDEAIRMHEKSDNSHHTHKRLAMYIKALAYLQLKQYEMATSLTEELKKSIDTSPHRNQIKFFFHILGRDALQRDDKDKAIGFFKKALDFQSGQRGADFGKDMHALFYYDLAEAHLRKQEVEQAVRFYEKIITLTTGRLYFGDIYAKSFYHLAKIYQRMGWNGKAIEYYQQFRKIWEKADNDLPELMDSRKQLALLRNKSS